MLRFFRIVRKSLIESNQMKKYIWYAIGEILLVVVGILIALQINNWNELRKERQETEIIKHNLFNEFEQNKAVLYERIALLEQSIDHSIAILKIIGTEVDMTHQSLLDSLLTQSMYYGNFNPSNSALQELIQSGKLKLISDDILKKHLFDWPQLLEDTNEDFKNQDLTANQFLVPYLTKKISFRNLGSLKNSGVEVGKSNLTTEGYSNIVHDIEFENLIAEITLWHTIMLRHYEELDILAFDILERLSNQNELPAIYGQAK